jgi:hypothetical protein
MVVATRDKDFSLIAVKTPFPWVDPFEFRDSAG